ncbi:MAG: YihY/virulence factor BrkB family protein, partial [Planctomycetes bacterium]|nr:YihY/virulence factor BrkB family protein [Planctomycetota bacterium]
MFPMTSIWIIYRACEKWSENGGTRHGAALAYYAVFSIAPLLLLAIYISGAIFGEDAAKGEVHKQLNTMMGEQVAMNVETMVKYASEPQSSWAPTISMVL